MIETIPPPNQPRAKPNTVRGRWINARIILVSIVILTPLVAVAVIVYPVFFTSHFHTVIPGRVYRGPHPSPERLDELKKEYGVRTVMNLRGDNPWLGWHKHQAAHLKKLGVRFESLNFSAERLPFASEVRKLIKAFDRAEHPIYMHCYHGVDRTGFAAAIYLLLYTDGNLDEARRQLSWRYGQVPFGKPMRLRVFFDDYETWLNQNGEAHTNERFRFWALNHYQANWSCEPLQFVEVPKKLNIHEPTTFRIRTRNTGKNTWPLRPNKRAGVHLWYQLVNLKERTAVEGRAGLVYKNVASGEAVEFTVVVPPVRKAGRYLFQADVIDEDEGNFYVIGSPILDLEIEARENVGANRN